MVICNAICAGTAWCTAGAQVAFVRIWRSMTSIRWIDNMLHNSYHWSGYVELYNLYVLYQYTVMWYFVIFVVSQKSDYLAPSRLVVLWSRETQTGRVSGGPPCNWVASEGKGSRRRQRFNRKLCSPWNFNLKEYSNFRALNRNIKHWMIEQWMFDCQPWNWDHSTELHPPSNYLITPNVILCICTRAHHG